MFPSLQDVEAGLRATGYISDSIATTTVYLAARLQKPLLLEGPAGSGKTQPTTVSIPSIQFPYLTEFTINVIFGATRKTWRDRSNTQSEST
jgi:hypothetical protein